MSDPDLCAGRFVGEANKDSASRMGPNAAGPPSEEMLADGAAAGRNHAHFSRVQNRKEAGQDSASQVEPNVAEAPSEKITADGAAAGRNHAHFTGV